MDNIELTQTQLAIHESAKKHFMQYGFQKASLNQIVKDAGFTKGAFYGYYRSKEELFCALVNGTVDGIGDILNQVNAKLAAYPAKEQVFHMTDEFLSVLPQLVDFVIAHHDEVTLLLKCSAGTRYEHFLDGLQSKDEYTGQNNMQSAFGGEVINKKTYQIMMSGYFSMLKSVFLSDMSRDEMIQAVTDIQMLFQTGIMSLVYNKTKGERT